MTDGRSTRGFAGLDAMVSVVEPEAIYANSVDAGTGTKRPKPQVKVKETTAQRIYTGEPLAVPTSTAKWWAIGIGLILLVSWVGAGGQSPKPTPAHLAQTAVPNSIPRVPAAPPQAGQPGPLPDFQLKCCDNEVSVVLEPRPAEPAPTYMDRAEEMPPTGRGLTLSRSQIRYCLSEKIRIAAWQREVNQYSDASVETFNAAVNNYNARCSDFRYRKGLLESVRSEIEADRHSLELQGLASARRNP